MRKQWQDSNPALLRQGPADKLGRINTWTSPISHFSARQQTDKQRNDILERGTNFLAPKIDLIYLRNVSSFPPMTKILGKKLSLVQKFGTTNSYLQQKLRKLMKPSSRRSHYSNFPAPFPPSRHFSIVRWHPWQEKTILPQVATPKKNSMKAFIWRSFRRRSRNSIRKKSRRLKISYWSNKVKREGWSWRRQRGFSFFPRLNDFFLSGASALRWNESKLGLDKET